MAQTVAKTPKKHTTAATPEVAVVRDAIPEDEWRALDWQVQRYLGMSGVEFLRHWLAGEWAVNPDQPGVLEWAAGGPLAERYAREHRPL